MGSDDFELNQNDNGKISVKKSTFNGLIIGLIAVVGIAAFFVGSYTSNLNSEQISEEDLSEAIAKLELKMLQNQLPTEQPKVPMKISADDDPVMGDPDAPITIIEFSDFQCPFCEKFHPTSQQVLQEYGDDVRWVYRHFPLDSIHPRARPSAMASECADEQGKFWEFANTLFANQSRI